MNDCYPTCLSNFHCSKMPIPWASCTMGFLRCPGFSKLHSFNLHVCTYYISCCTAVLSKKAVTAFLTFELGPQSVLHTNPTHWYRVRKAYLNSRLRLLALLKNPKLKLKPMVLIRKA